MTKPRRKVYTAAHRLYQAAGSLEFVADRYSQAKAPLSVTAELERLLDEADRALHSLRETFNLSKEPR